MKDNLAQELRESAKATFYEPLKSELNRAADHIEKLEAALRRCDELFSYIRNDWSDPRSECREGWRVIEEALEGTCSV